MEYPIAEVFHSIQGEGTFAGAAMAFIRLAGCNVGCQPQIDVSTHSQNKLASLAPICESVLGEKFHCDTDYKVKSRVGVDDLVEDVREDFVCITGGEPFLHDLGPLVSKLEQKGIAVHIETSGTRPIPRSIALPSWITVSPKKGFLEENRFAVDEYKFVVSTKTDFDNIAEFLHGDTVTPVFLQPIDDVGNNGLPAKYLVDRIYVAQREHPNWRLSLQLHKLLKIS